MSITSITNSVGPIIQSGAKSIWRMAGGQDSRVERLWNECSQESKNCAKGLVSMTAGVLTGSFLAVESGSFVNVLTSRTIPWKAAAKGVMLAVAAGSTLTGIDVSADTAAKVGVCAGLVFTCATSSVASVGGTLLYFGAKAFGSHVIFNLVSNSIGPVPGALAGLSVLGFCSAGATFGATAGIAGGLLTSALLQKSME
jgi:hypothetical protein